MGWQAATITADGRRPESHGRKLGYSEESPFHPRPPETRSSQQLLPRKDNRVSYHEIVPACRASLWKGGGLRRTKLCHGDSKCLGGSVLTARGTNTLGWKSVKP